MAAAGENVYDRYARFAAKVDPPGFLRWLFRGLDDDLRFTRWLESQPAARPGQPERRLDTVAELTHASGLAPPWAVLVEFQLGPDADMLERGLEYLARVRRELRYDAGTRDKYLVAAAVVNLTGVQARPRLDMVLPGDTGNDFHWGPTVRNLQEESASELLDDIEAGRTAAALLVWASLMAGGERADMIERWKGLAGREPDAHRRADYGVLVRLFARLAGREEVWALGLKEWNMGESTILDEWMAKGEAIGVAKGEARGEVKGLQEALLRVLRRRFPNTPGDFTDLVRSQNDPNELGRLLDLAMDVPSLDAFRAALPPKPNGSAPP